LLDDCTILANRDRLQAHARELTFGNTQRRILRLFEDLEWRGELTVGGARQHLIDTQRLLLPIVAPVRERVEALAFIKHARETHDFRLESLICAARARDTESIRIHR